MVYVSWNGATEVATWNLYKTNHEGISGTNEPVAAVPRSGFETSLRYGGYATYVVVEAVDKNGDLLGRSRVVKTIVSSALSDKEVVEEEHWLQTVGMKEQDNAASSWSTKAKSKNPIASFIIFLVSETILILVIRLLRRVRRQRLFSKHPRGPASRPVTHVD